MDGRPLLMLLHVSGVVVWVGEMFFAHACLRPVAASLLEPPARLQLWGGIFARFFLWAGASIAAIVASGAAMLAAAGGAVPPAWWAMSATGLLMVVVFVRIVTGPYAALRAAVDAADWKRGVTALGSIRQLVGLNLTLGLLTIVVATAGRWLG